MGGEGGGVYIVHQQTRRWWSMPTSGTALQVTGPALAGRIKHLLPPFKAVANGIAAVSIKNGRLSGPAHQVRKLESSSVPQLDCGSP